MDKLSLLGWRFVTLPMFNIHTLWQTELQQVRDQLVDLGISEYGGQEALDYLAELETEAYKLKYKHISMDALRHIFLDLRMWGYICDVSWIQPVLIKFINFKF